MTTSKLKRIGLPAALVVGGVTAGSFLAPIGLASAQEADTDGAATEDSEAESSEAEDSEVESSESEAEEAEKDRRGHRRAHRRGHGFEALTETLDLTKDEIRQGFADGKSIADMAEEQGVDLDDVRAALVASATEHLDAAVEADRIDEDEAAEKLAEFESNIDERLTTVPDLSERDGNKGRRGHRGAGLEALEDTLGLSSDEIRAGLQEGKTLSDLAEEQGVSVEDLAGQLIASMEERLDQAVEDGKIEEERADEIREGLEEKVEERLNSEFDGSRGRGHGRRGHHHDRGGNSTGGDSTGGETVDTSVEI